MRLANRDGRAVLITDDGATDVATASGGQFGPALADIYAQWDAFGGWAAGATLDPLSYEVADLDSPCPDPRQVFAIGLNYRAHAEETGKDIPEYPVTFTKFPSCITGPAATVTLPSGSVDWEVELVVVIGKPAHKVSAADGWAHVAGLTVGQDFSERAVQMRPPVPQFSLGKSYPGFGATGPWLTTPDELSDPDDLAISCSINGEEVQSSTTADLIFSIARLIEELSSIVALLPGDVIFTGTPSGVGVARTPPRFLAPGDVVCSTIAGLGSITTTCA